MTQNSIDRILDKLENVNQTLTAVQTEVAVLKVQVNSLLKQADTTQSPALVAAKTKVLLALAGILSAGGGALVMRLLGQ